MVYLKEDGSLDVERIDKLSWKEYVKALGDLTEEQFEEYESKQPINESQVPIEPANVDITLDELLAEGCATWEEIREELLK